MKGVVPPLAELFPDENYEFRLTLRRAEPREFFRQWDESGVMLRERARWLEEEPERYAGLRAEGTALLDEFVELAAGWVGRETLRGRVADEGLMREVGRVFEPDVLLLSADEMGRFRLRGGALCFPTGWALEEKIGHTLEAIHGVVPGLNPALGGQIEQFLGKLKPGAAYLRDNWGIAATDTLNLHPARAVRAPEQPARLEELWLRVEHQALVALPRTRGVVFGIRIASHRLDTVAGGPAAAGLRRALETMPAELAFYKRLERIRKDVIRLL